MSAASFSTRLSNAWRALRGAALPAFSGDSSDALLTAQADTARERIRADETNQSLTAIRRELDAEKNQRTAAVASALAAKLEPVLTDAATTLGQLALQHRLIEDGKPVTARDVMALAQNLARAFHQLGLTPQSQPGDTVTFDPTLHQPLGGAAPAAGTPVVVRLPGYQLSGRLLRKSFVEPPKS